jgi:hypothetical protein
VLQDLGKSEIIHEIISEVEIGRALNSRKVGKGT